MLETENAVFYPEEDFVEALYMAVQKTKQFQKACTKWKNKPACEFATKAQARTYSKDVYEIFDEVCNSLHKMGVANNAVMQGKLDKLTAENVQIKLDMANNQAKNKKYHQVIETAMSMSRAPTEETDDLTLQTQQWSAFTVSQEKEFAYMRK